jgi:hypothetical protein
MPVNCGILPCARLLVELLRIAPFAFRERGVDEDLGEGNAPLLGALGSHRPVGPEGRDKRGDDHDAGIGKVDRQLGRTAQVLAAVVGSEAEVPAQAGAKDVAVQDGRKDARA